VDDSSVSSLGCGEQVLSISNLDEARQRINVSSSQGPTRDGRFKPDVAAPGTDIVAALGFNFDDNQQWIGMTGTSMASPFACGVVGTAHCIANSRHLAAYSPPTSQRRFQMEE
jgi:subtilisin family serine protease